MSPRPARGRRGNPVVAGRLIDEPFAIANASLHLRPAELMAIAYPGSWPAGDGGIDIHLAPHHRGRLRLPARIAFRTPIGADDRPAIALSWHARRAQRLFPVMDAGIRVRATAQGRSELIFDGNYHPPLGLAGMLGDVIVGRRVAQATAEAFLDELAAAIGSDAQHQHGQHFDHLS